MINRAAQDNGGEPAETAVLAGADAVLHPGVRAVPGVEEWSGDAFPDRPT